MSALKITIATALLAGCLKQATVPAVSREGDPQARQQTYEQSKLTYQSGFFSTSWKRGDTNYAWASLRDLAKSHPDTEDLYERAQHRGAVIGGLAGLGGGVLGFTLAYNLTADDSKKMSSGTQTALYATGGGLIVVAVIVAIVWHNPVSEFADTYNRDLKTDLDVASRPHRRARVSSALRISSDGFGWAF